MKRYYTSWQYIGDETCEAGPLDECFVLYSEAEARIEALEWLVEVMDLYGFLYDDDAERWTTDQEDNALGELYLSMEAARAAAGV